MEFNLIQLWLMLQLTIRDSEAEGIVVIDRDNYYAVKSKLNVVMNEAGITMEQRKQYTLDEEEDNKVRPSERDAVGECGTCGRRHKHKSNCATLARRRLDAEVAARRSS